ncbi:S-adenosyl-L-methionine-dependent methyltransferase [Lipomyces japonicus]|uniref:S-adenosyl-L-methionine-dependent methyltransferase n=1 Tax=Lipomyces japonicus TaxID=56871 RepID=UPI0034CF6F09
MRQCLTNPEGGYYMNKDPFGAGGDFITSPEISQMFGELVGVWVLTEWLAQNKPSRLRLVELGPGRGTLMSDMLLALQSYADIKKSISEICFIEASPTLREMQRLKLGGRDIVKTDIRYESITSSGIPVYWYEDFKDLPTDDIPPFIVAHEFFDALPIHKFEKTADGWREILVNHGIPKLETSISLPNQITSVDDKPQFYLTVPKHATPGSRIIPESSIRYKKLPVLSKIEISPQSWEITREIALRISQTPGINGTNGCGAALFVDYGPADTIPIDTLRAIEKHHIVSPFETPGSADLSADVDFTALKIVAETQGNVDVHGAVEQGDWLHTLGIGIRATVLAERQRDEQGKERIEKAYHRLTERSGGGMGKIYKVMALTPRGSPTPVGFGGNVVGTEKDE